MFNKSINKLLVLQNIFYLCPTIQFRVVEKFDIMQYSELPFKEWDGKTPLEDLNYEIENANNHKKLEDLQLCIASPNYLWFPDFNDIYIDIMPEDQYLDDLMSKDLKKAFGTLEEAIRHEPPEQIRIGKKYLKSHLQLI